MLDSTSAQAKRLNIGSGPVDSTTDRAWTSRHQPGPRRIDIDSGPDDSTSIWALKNSTSLRAQTTLLRSNVESFGPERLNIKMGLNELTLAQARSARQRLEPARLNNGPRQTTRSALARRTRHQPWPERLNIGLGSLDIKPNPIDSTSARAKQLKIGLGPIDSTSDRARTTLHKPRPKRLDIDSSSTRAHTKRHQFGFVRLDIGPSPNDSPSVQTC